ncbi:MAG: glycosyltransferase family 4 protein, partial [Chloroflexi bacterium]|nr:glycosyltransferase family 4 protein [Chloroflexota bacterium]
DHALMRKMGRAGRERARLFGIERHVTQLLEVYQIAVNDNLK